MSRAVRTRTPTFRFNRNEDDLLEEVIQTNEELSETNDSVDTSLNLSIESVDNSLTANDHNSSHLSALLANKDRLTVRDFFNSKLNKTKSLDEDNSKESGIASNWFNDMKIKIKEKIDERKREKELKQSINTDVSDNDVQKETTIVNKNVMNETNEENNRNKINHLSGEDNETIPLVTDLQIQSIDNSYSVNENLIISKSFENPMVSIVPEIDNKCEDKCETRQLLHLNNYSRIVNITAAVIAFISLIISMALPVPSFISGLLFGFILTVILFSVLGFYLISNYLVVTPTDSRKNNIKKDVIITNVTKDDEIHKGWVYEFIGNYGERDSGFKVQLIYVRLQGSNLRLSKPKHDLKKQKLNSNSLPVFISQRFFDLSKILHKRVYLLLPKSVRNQKKYVWSKKYPICLELEDIKTKNIVKLILFIRNCREKEEWFWKLREKIQQNLYSLIGASDPPTPNTSCDTISTEMDRLPRTQSLDLGSLQSATTFSSMSNSPTSPSKELLILSKQIDYNFFINNLVTLKTDNTSSLSWFNALIGRICFDILNEPFWSTYIAAKIQRKLRRLRLPYFMESLTITEIDVGSTLPSFNSVPNPPIVDSKGLWIDFDITYSGGFTMTLETKLNLMKLKEQANGAQEMKNFSERPDLDLSDNDSDSILSSSEDEIEEKPPVDLEDADNTKKQQKILKFVDKIASSPYFQKVSENKYVKRAMEEVSKTALILTVQIQTLNGTLAINIPEPPTDRLWYGFRGNPDLVLSARPKLGEHEVSISHITDIIERKLRAEFAKVLVMPNMDDLVIPVLTANIEQYVTTVP
ncbi:testis-expressed protein 2-like [Oppia nitens]|uniref:testis-expressed protein 2-like n=1 Tax=Oppia nitens TaxID=1686743 RepID=UPI0023DCCA92|nr:testis-expressed protein 2-like [Oppia nitens]